MNIPYGATSIVQWFKMGDHPKVLQDYESGCIGDVDLDKWFVVNVDGSFTDVVPGDYVLDMSDGSVKVRKPE